MGYELNRAANWDRKWHHDEITRSLERQSVWDVLDDVKFSYLMPLIEKTGSALEVGCGSARLLAMLANRGWKTAGIDFAPSALELARRRFERGKLSSEWVRADCYRMPFRDGSYDLVASTGLLEHFADPAPIVSEMIRVLRPGGVFYSDVVPRKFSLIRALDRVGSSPGKDEIFERTFNREEIAGIMSRFMELREIHVCPAGVFLPRKLFSRRLGFMHRNEYRINRFVTKLLRRLDGSWLADRLGFYYLVTGRKA